MQGQKTTLNSMSNSKMQLNRDLTYILHGKKMRKVGEQPEFMGGFTKIAPTQFSNSVLKII